MDSCRLNGDSMKLGFNTQNYLVVNRQANQNKNTSSSRQDVSFGDSLGIIKPEVMHLEKDILKLIKDAGFEIVEMPAAKLSKDLVKQHYSQLRQKAASMFMGGNNSLMNIYRRVENNMLKGSSKVFVVKGDEAEVLRFKDFVGATVSSKRDPNSLRAIIEKMEVERLQKSGASQKKIDKFRATFSFVHASDADWFDKAQTIKNYDREIKLHNPEYYDKFIAQK